MCVARLFRVAVSAQIALYFVVADAAPILILPQGIHDDGLFMRLGRSLADGEWLGPYNQFTLMKGPGYPLFLAVSHWLGMPISMGHAILHCAAIALLALVCRRLTESPAGAFAIFTLLLWVPVAFTEPLLRVFREAIYYAQVLLMIGVLGYSLPGDVSLRWRSASAALGGALLGWTYLTREEGIWLLPGLGILIAGALWRAYRTGAPKRHIAVAGLVALGLFAATEVGFRVLNYRAYGNFVSVEVRERNFSRALRAIHSVRSGGVASSVSVTRATRRHIYPVSPSFASLANFLESPFNGWAGLTCRWQAENCGEIGAGWFLWALRDGAASTGHYSSPAEASAFFGRIADEITGACRRGQLHCSPQLVAEMPPFELGVLARVPANFVRAVHVTFGRFSVDPPASAPEAHPLFDVYVKFLGSPQHRVPPRPPVYTLNGWYYRAGAEWFDVKVTDLTGGGVDLTLVRTESPDLTVTSSAATRQRYTLRTACPDDCTMRLSGINGAGARVMLRDLKPMSGYKVGEGTFFVETVQRIGAPDPSLAERFSQAIRAAIEARFNSSVVPIVLGAGLAAFVITTTWYWRTATLDTGYLLGLACAVLAACRIGVNVLVDLTAFRALHPFYLAPAAYLSLAAAVLFLVAFAQQRRLHALRR